MNNFVYRVFQTLTITFPLELPSIMSTKAFGMRSKPSETVSWPWKVVRGECEGFFQQFGAL